MWVMIKERQWRLAELSRLLIKITAGDPWNDWFVRGGADTRWWNGIVELLDQVMFINFTADELRYQTHKAA